MSVGLVVVSHSEKIADGAVELAAQMAPDVVIIPAGGADDGRIGTSLERVIAALEQAAGADGIVVLADLGSAVMTAESAVEFAADPGSVLLADAPLVEGLVAAAVAAQVGADAEAVKEAAEAVYRPPAAPEHVHEHRQPPEAAGDFELVNQAGMHARPAAKIAGGLSGMDAEVTVNGADGASMTELMMLGAGRGTVLHVGASGPDAAKAVDYVGGLITSGFGEP
ncbi:MAG: dihydroxyacetone kinase [Arthrobacter sp.]|jgi:PTS hybrid protein|nr:dihydroxyacetone kinase [Arthrobacter sp.]MCU1553726.1 dihydroxyacetone kinase [Arthrobacter sp.]